MSSDEYVDDYEDVSGYHLADENERLLIQKQTECTFMWTNRSGEPVGVRLVVRRSTLPPRWAARRLVSVPHEVGRPSPV